MKRCIAIISFTVLFLLNCAKASQPDVNTVYDSDPNHLWNRLNKTLFERTASDGKEYGLDQLDILYWQRTTNLLTGVSHQEAMAILNKFINTHGEKLVQDPLKKALLQRDLWALFDWVTVPTPFPRAKFPNERRELESRLATVIHRLALTTNEIASLPDNYALAVKNHLRDLPAGLFVTNGDWMNVSPDNELPILTLIPLHTASFGGRSVFTVWFRDPDGHKAGAKYLKRLGAISPTLVINPNFTNDMMPNPALPQFPTNTQWALARCMCVIDTDGTIQPTHVVESIQLRAYFGFGAPEMIMVTNQNGYVVPTGIPPQRFNEFQMTRNAQANLISLPQEDRDFVFVHFMGMGIDLFESYPTDELFNVRRVKNRVLGTCATCHFGSGILSVNSFTGMFSMQPAAEKAHLIESAPEHESEVTVDWKQQQFDWGLLQGLWNQQ